MSRAHSFHKAMGQVREQLGTTQPRATPMSKKSPHTGICMVPAEVTNEDLQQKLFKMRLERDEARNEVLLLREALEALYAVACVWKDEDCAAVTNAAAALAATGSKS